MSMAARTFGRDPNAMQRAIESRGEFPPGYRYTTATSTSTPTTRAEAEAVLHGLALGLEGPDGAQRLLERIAAQPEPEMLRALLLELGALALVATVEAGRGTPTARSAPGSGSIARARLP